MTNVNVTYGVYDEKVNNLYDKEFALNESLKVIVATAIADLRLLNARYKYASDIERIISKFTTSDYRNFDTPYVNTRDTIVMNHTFADKTNVKYNMLLFKCRLLLSATIRLFHSNNRLVKYKNMKMPYYSFNYLNTAVNNEMAKSILRGYNFNFGVGVVNMGTIKVQEIERKYNEDGTPTDKSINWEESNLLKQALIADNIEVYNKETSPNGRKWFIYHTEPFVYYINWVISMYSHKMIKYFKFEPTAFINTKNRSSSDILDNYNIDVEDIINNPKLGFTTKLNTLLKKDPSYALTYR